MSGGTLSAQTWRTFRSSKIGVILVAGQFEYFGTTEWWDPEYRDWSMVSFNQREHGWLYGFTTISISGTPYFFGKPMTAHFPFSAIIFGTVTLGLVRPKVTVLINDDG